MHKERDSKLVLQCKQGDRPAMETLVAHYERSVFNVSYRLLGDRDHACNVTRIAFIKTFANIQRVDEKTIFFIWLYRFAVNESAKQLKFKTREYKVDQEKTGAPQSELNDQVQQPMMRLSPDLRNVLVLKYFTECSYAQIADILQLPEKQMKSRLYEARQKLQNDLVAGEVLSS